jgi:multisubunit Na+/H+ antiporter MnhE subunit
MRTAKLDGDRKGYRKILAGWLFLAVLYVALSGTIEALGLIAAVVCASASLAITLPLLRTRRETGRLELSPRLNVRIARLVWRDCIAIARASILALLEVATRREPDSGVFRERHLESHARADIVALVLSLAPNSYVVDTRREDERVVFHHLIAPQDDDPTREAWPP